MRAATVLQGKLRKATGELFADVGRHVRMCHTSLALKAVVCCELSVAKPKLKRINNRNLFYLVRYDGLCWLVRTFGLDLHVDETTVPVSVRLVWPGLRGCMHACERASRRTDVRAYIYTHARTDSSRPGPC